MNKFKLLIIDKDMYFRNSIHFGKNTILLKLYSTYITKSYFKYSSVYKILDRKLFNGRCNNTILKSINYSRRYINKSQYTEKYLYNDNKSKNIFEVTSRENIDFFSSHAKELKLTY